MMSPLCIVSAYSSARQSPSDRQHGFQQSNEQQSPSNRQHDSQQQQGFRQHRPNFMPPCLRVTNSASVVTEWPNQRGFMISLPLSAIPNATTPLSTPSCQSHRKVAMSGSVTVSMLTLSVVFTLPRRLVTSPASIMRERRY